MNQEKRYAKYAEKVARQPRKNAEQARNKEGATEENMHKKLL